jgi:hypothetical protein
MAVIGGGIAGCGAAWALARGGGEGGGGGTSAEAAACSVEVFDAHPERLGGNAKTHQWAGTGAVSGLSVLAWPRCYFRNYEALLAELDVPIAEADVRFYLAARTAAGGAEGGGGGAVRVCCHPPVAGSQPVRPACDLKGMAAETITEAWGPDLDKWERLVRFVARVNAWFAAPVGSSCGCRQRATGPPAKSLYATSLLNPLNVLSLRRLSRLFCVSRQFWDEVFVAVHSSSFLTVGLDELPAMVAPTLEDIFTLRSGGTLGSWASTSREVFEKLSEPLAKVHQGAAVTAVAKTASGKWAVTASTGDQEVVHGEYDTVVFACPAGAALAALAAGGQAGVLARWLLGSVEYVEKHDTTFAAGKIHTDAGVLGPPGTTDREAIQAGFANYVEVVERPAGRRGEGGGGARRHDYTNTFVLSSWAPSLQTDPPSQAVPARPCLVTCEWATSRISRQCSVRIFRLNISDRTAYKFCRRPIAQTWPTIRPSSRRSRARAMWKAQ